MKTILFFIRAYFMVISKIAPKMAAKHAFSLFQTPLNKSFKKRERKLYAVANTFSIPFEQEDIVCYELGDPNGKLVFLVHGWDSNAGSLGGIADELVRLGYYVVTFDLPAFGHSSLKKSNIKLCSDALLAVMERYSSDEPFSVVSHSFGSAVTTYTLSRTNYTPDKMVMLTTPNRLQSIFREFKGMVSLGDSAYYKLIAIADKVFGEPVEEVSIEERITHITANEIVLMHDQFDKVLPYENSLAVSNSHANARLVVLEKVGHYRMLWDENVLRQISEIMKKTSSKVEETREAQMMTN